MKVRVKNRRWARVLNGPVLKVVVAILLIAFVVVGGYVLHLYDRYARVIDARLTGAVFHRPTILFAAPQTIYLGESISAQQVAHELQMANYSDTEPSPIGHYRFTPSGIEIQPGPESFHSPQPAAVVFNHGQITAITDPQTKQALSRYSLEPMVLTTLFGEHRDKRRLLKYSDLPPMLVKSVLAIEDRTFFEHGAFDYWRILGAAYNDLRRGRLDQGGSTIDMQLARDFFLTPRKTFRRKIEEMIIAFEIAQRMNRRQIFELYANEVYMGQRGTYTIRGFGEAARTYFGVPVNKLTLPQCALLGGLVQGPNRLTPFRYPQRARVRRNEVLHALYVTHWINRDQMEKAIQTPIQLNPASIEVSDAPYFVDLVRDQLEQDLPREALATRSYHVYTTLDPDLQRAAAIAVRDGMKRLDALVRQRRTHRVRVHGRWKTVVAKGPEPEVALIALDPHTGAVKALIGGTNYAHSQFEHILSPRPTGSIFKPFVYATAFNTALDGEEPLITEASTVVDEPTIFQGGYAPHNFRDEYYGRVPIRVALEHSLNNGTIALADEVGYSRVADLARAAGITSVEPTPAMAIGAYAASPWQMAQAWTIFANQGDLEHLHLWYAVQTDSGEVVDRELPNPRQLLDPRVAFLTTNLLESVLNHGTGVGARDMGFTAPAAAKTGSSHDGWFAGYTSNLLCLVWTGYDDYQNLNIQGAHSALPIWAEFMKMAVKLPQYADVQPFAPPPGVVAEKLDPQSQQVATAYCPNTQLDYFIAGTQPTVLCALHPGPSVPHSAVGRLFSFFHLVPRNPAPPQPQSAIRSGGTGATTVIRTENLPPPQPSPTTNKKKKKSHRGFFARLFGLDKKHSSQPQHQQQPQD
ncbi:MAG: transglycosylase domain-containing protein [Terriglobales bacterium]